MPENPNETDPGATMVRSSIMLPAWMDDRLEAEARRTFSSKAQIIRQRLADTFEREAEEAVA